MIEQRKFMGRYHKNVIVLGSARSGTSWLSENLAKPFRYRMLFEPEHDERTPKGHLLTDQFFTLENPPSKKALHYLHCVFKNRVDSDWIAQNSNRKYKRHLWPFIPKKIIIKFVRFNLSGAYLAQKFDVPVVHIIRNPLKVIESQKRVMFPWLLDFKFFLQQPHLVDLLKLEFNYDLSTINEKPDAEKLAVRWCIENVIPLQVQRLPSRNFWIVKHEDLRSDISIYKKLCEDLNLDVIENIENEYRKPSSKTHPKSAVHAIVDERSFLDQEEVQKIKNILNTFHQEFYEL